MKINLINEIIRVGREAWNQSLTAGRSGNISARQERDFIITANGTCLGMLEENSFVNVDLNGNIKKGQKPSSELPLHLSIYKNTDSKAVVHLHPPFSSAFFATNKVINPLTFEEKLILGQIPIIEQHTPAVTDINPVLEALKLSNIVVLKNHGVVAVGETLWDAFFLIQILEQSVKMEVVNRLTSCCSAEVKADKPAAQSNSAETQGKKYRLFSKEQINRIVELVNQDENFLKQASDTNLTLTLAVKINETGEVYKFDFVKGKITEVTNKEDAEFLITGPKAIWEAIFRRQIDPFVATTQKKLNLKGDFAKISKWYAPFARLFVLWQQVPIE